MKCLIIDDEEVSRNLMCSYVEGLGECHAVSSGKGALELITAKLDDSNPYDLILMDIVMPQMDGHKTARAIREIENERGIPAGKRVKIIMVTAMNSPKDAMEAIGSAQSSAYLVKPVSKANLLGVIGKLLIGKL